DGDVWRRTVQWLAEAARAAEACEDPRRCRPATRRPARGS
ncbi:hypothetical protein GA0115236_14801, partial [Streptomyces sp. IgraMP-1]